MANPVFNSNFGTGAAASVQAAKVASAQELEALYRQPAASPDQTDRMSVEDTITKTAGIFAVLLIAAAFAWFLTPSVPALLWIGLAGGLVLGLVNAFKKEPSPPLIFAYAGAKGLFLGSLSMVVEHLYPGVVIQAVIGTLIVFGVVLALFRSGRVRVSARANKIFLIAIVSYGLFSLVNLGLQLTGTLDGWGINSVAVGGVPLGLIIGPLAILLASYSLVQDFDFIQQGSAQGLPRRYGWKAAFGLTVTLVWLYVEILRLLAIMRGD